jgi:hypothetical protein
MRRPPIERRLRRRTSDGTSRPTGTHGDRDQRLVRCRHRRRPFIVAYDFFALHPGGDLPIYFEYDVVDYANWIDGVELHSGGDLLTWEMTGGIDGVPPGVGSWMSPPGYVMNLDLLEPGDHSYPVMVFNNQAQTWAVEATGQTVYLRVSE